MTPYNAGVRISYIRTPPTISIKVHFPILAEIPWHANLHCSSIFIGCLS